MTGAILRLKRFLLFLFLMALLSLLTIGVAKANGFKGLDKVKSSDRSDRSDIASNGNDAKNVVSTDPLSSSYSADKSKRALGKIFSQEFGNILFDLRNSRGGNGDVAAGYLTLMTFLDRYQIKNKLTLLVDQEGEKRLSSFLTTDFQFPENVDIKTLESLEKDLKIDFYLALASPSGTLKNHPRENLHFTEHALLMVQTVLGNTENPNSLNPMALIEVDGKDLNMNPAGIEKNEAGYYSDYVAAKLRHKSEIEVRQFILNELQTFDKIKTAEVLKSVINGQTLNGSKVGLVYGITALTTRSQFTSYLSGLAKLKENSFCLITPSHFDTRYISDPQLKERIVIFDTEIDKIPDQAEKGKIYVLKIPNIPHSVFVGLTAFSMKQGITPVGAGDGFLSAGLILGEPFVLTRVAWNENNIENLKASLLREYIEQKSSSKVNLIKPSTQLISQSERLDSKNLNDLAEARNTTSDFNLNFLLNQIYGEINLDRALELQNLKPLFQNLAMSFPDLTDNIINAALGVRQIFANFKDPEQRKAKLQTLGLTFQKDPLIDQEKFSKKSNETNSLTKLQSPALAKETEQEQEQQLQLQFLIDSIRNNLNIPEAAKAEMLRYLQETHATKHTTNQCAKQLKATP